MPREAATAEKYIDPSPIAERPVHERGGAGVRPTARSQGIWQNRLCPSYIRVGT